MANTINFSSAFVRTASYALNDGTKKVRINITASLTKEVREKMDWLEIERPKNLKGRLLDEAAEGISLEGELHGKTMRLTPNEKELAKAGFEIEIGQVHAFTLATVQDGDSKRRELRFQVMTTAKGALGELEKYTDRVGQAKATLRISYVQQSEMELAAGAEDVQPTEQQRQAVLEAE